MRINVDSTADIRIPKKLLDRVIGQDEAVRLAKIAVKQRRHLLLVGVPGTGKSMIAKGMSQLLSKPKQQISVVHNPEYPYRPKLIIETNPVDASKKIKERVVSPLETPVEIAEKLGFRCKFCGRISSPDEVYCPYCGSPKYRGKKILRSKIVIETEDGGERQYIRERDNIKIVDIPKEVKERREINVIVPKNRNNFVMFSGGSETELLGDVEHDPYGGRPGIGIPPYKRVISGAIHQAHEGILYIDEISNIGYLQRFLLTAMQEKKFPITGKNPTSSGAIVKVEDVPCDFILVGGVNIYNLEEIIPPLRSRIRGYGYEVLLNSYMPATKENIKKFIRYIAQEIKEDGKIPHANKSAIMELLKYAKHLAYKLDNQEDAITLRLREVNGVIRGAGDLAVLEKSEYIDKYHVKTAIKSLKPIEEKLFEKYKGNPMKAYLSEFNSLLGRDREYV